MGTYEFKLTLQLKLKKNNIYGTIFVVKSAFTSKNSFNIILLKYCIFSKRKFLVLFD